MTNLNITPGIIAAYKVWEKATITLESSSTGSKAEKMAVTASRKKFAKAVTDAGNAGDWDANKIIVKLMR